MSKSTQRIYAMLIAVPAALVLTAVSALLVTDYVTRLRQAPQDAKTIERLKISGVYEPDAEAQLTAEFDRSAAQSLQRDLDHRRKAWIIIVSATVFLLASNWYMALNPRKLPPKSVTATARTARMRLTAAQDSPHRPGRAKSPFSDDAPPRDDIDFSIIDRIIERLGREPEQAIAVIQAIQQRFRYLPDAALRHVCEHTEITPAQISGVSSFYAQFRRSPVGRHIIKVCHGTACHVAGARIITDEVRRFLEIAADADTDPRREFTMDEVACLGCCSLAPVMMVDDVIAGNLTPVEARDCVAEWRAEAAPWAK